MHFPMSAYLCVSDGFCVALRSVAGFDILLPAEIWKELGFMVFQGSNFHLFDGYASSAWPASACRQHSNSDCH